MGCPGQARALRAPLRLEEEGHLTLQVPGNVRFRLYADSDSEFVVKRAPWRVAFRRDAAGNATALLLDMDGTEVRAERVEATVPPPAVVAGNASLDLPLDAAEMARYEGRYTFRIGEQALPFDGTQEHRAGAVFFRPANLIQRIRHAQGRRHARPA